MTAGLNLSVNSQFLLLPKTSAMPDQYLLPCSCGNSIPIETTQAGQSIECPACQLQVEIPSYSQIKQLQLEDSLVKAKSKPQPRKEWGYGQGVLFALGLAMFLFFTILGGVFFFLYNRANVDTPTVDARMKGDFAAFVDKMPPADRFTFWEENQKVNPPSEWKPPDHLFTQAFSKAFFTLAIVCSILAVVGFACLMSAFFIKQGGTKKRAKQKSSGKQSGIKK